MSRTDQDTIVTCPGCGRRNRVLDRITGAVDAARMRRWIEPHLAPSRA